MILGGAAAAGAGMLGGNASRKRAQRKQDEAIDGWLDYQRDATDVAQASTDANRDANYGALGDVLAGATREARDAVINRETNRLYGAALAPNEVVDPGYSSGDYKSFAARKLAEATREARKMVRAQAKTRAYGDSYGGMGTTRREAIQTGANEIGFNNEMTGIDLGVLAAKQRVQPEMFQHQSTGLGELLTSVGSGFVGQGLAGVDLGGLFGAGGAPATPPRPMPNPRGPWPSAPGTVVSAPASAAPATYGIGFGTLPPMGYLFPANRPDAMPRV